MHLSDRRLNAMIAKDPVTVSYVLNGETITMNGLLHRSGTERAKSETEGDAGSTENPNLRVMLRVADVGENLPPEETVVTVNGVNYRNRVNELASDSNHYILHLTDENA